MIELLLQAERLLSLGLLDQAERTYRQAAEADPRNSIAVVGLARVALERGDEPEAWRLARRALEIDPENVAAQRLAARLEEVWAFRGASLPEAAGASAGGAVAEPDRAVTSATSPASTEPSVEPAPAAPFALTPPRADPAIPTPPSPVRRTVVDRLLRRNRP